MKISLSKLLAALATLVMVVLVWAVWSVLRMTKPDIDPSEVESSTTSAASSTSVMTTAPTQPSVTKTVLLCILGEWEGKLAVFSPGGVSPEEVYDVYITSLPEQEQARLEKGIEIYDFDILYGLLEDYTS